MPQHLVCMLALCIALIPGLARADYLGAQGCVPCHAAIHDTWQKTRHAGAMYSLTRDGHGENMTCLPCHTTGYGEVMGFLDMNATPELAGVQCEACHGPSRVHAESPEDSGATLRLPSVEICQKCHTPDQDSAFQYENMKKKVH